METAKYPKTKVWLHVPYTCTTWRNLRYVCGPFEAHALYTPAGHRGAYVVIGPCNFTAQVRSLGEAREAMRQEILRPGFKFC